MRKGTMRCREGAESRGRSKIKNGKVFVSGREGSEKEPSFFFVM